MVWSSWRRGWVEGRGLEGRRVVALIDSARVVAAGPGTLLPPLGAPIPEPAPFPASHPFWFPRRHPEVVVQRRVRPTSALSRSIARGRGSTGQGLCALHEGPTYLEYTRPSRSSTRPSCSARPRLARRLRATASAMSGEPADDFTPGSSPRWSLSARTRGTGAQDLRSRTRLMRCSASLAGTRAARPGKVIRSGSVKGGFWCDSNRCGCHYF